VFFRIYEELRDIFDFDILSYNCMVSGLLSRDDRRHVDETEVEKMFQNERSISTLTKLNNYDLMFKRGYYFVRKNDKEINESKNKSEYSSYMRKYNIEFSKTRFDDKFLDSGPESLYDKKKVRSKKIFENKQNGSKVSYKRKENKKDSPKVAYKRKEIVGSEVSYKRKENKKESPKVTYKLKEIVTKLQ